MAGSNLLVDYLGKGLHAARPASLTLASGATGIYYETDTGDTFAWDGSAWQQVNTGGAGTVTSIVAGTGLSGGTITSTGTISIPSQGGLTAGSYTNTNLTVDARGIITAAANGTGGGAGAVSLISTQTANNTATNIAWTGLTGEDYILSITAMVPATNAADIMLQFGEGGTPTWKTANYDTAWKYLVFTSGVSTGEQWFGAGSGILIGNAVDNTNSGLLYSTMNMHGLASAIPHFVDYTSLRSNGGTNYTRLHAMGKYTGDTTAITAVRIITSSGNLSSGSASLYAVSRT